MDQKLQQVAMAFWTWAEAARRRRQKLQQVAMTYWTRPAFWVIGGFTTLFLAPLLIPLFLVILGLSPARPIEATILLIALPVGALAFFFAVQTKEQFAHARPRPLTPVSRVCPAALDCAHCGPVAGPPRPSAVGGRRVAQPCVADLLLYVLSGRRPGVGDPLQFGTRGVSGNGNWLQPYLADGKGLLGIVRGQPHA